MQRLNIREYGKLTVGDGENSISAALFERLHRYDTQTSGKTNHEVFRWSYGYAQAQQYVGVIQIPGLQVEILPKVDRDDDSPRSADAADAKRAQGRAQLLYMLHISGMVTSRQRHFAAQGLSRLPLLEGLAQIFAQHLHSELANGVLSGYISCDEQLRYFKGRLLVAQHVRMNAAHRERFYLRHSVYSADNPLNRVLKAACRRLLSITRAPSVHSALDHCLGYLAEVEDVPIAGSTLASMVLSRQQERFADLFHFARIILSDQTPTFRAGRSQTFSLIFDMNMVFERFIAGFLRRHVLPLFEDAQMRTQKGDTTRYLLRQVQPSASAQGHRSLLKPDVFIWQGGRRLVIDTKWKRLRGDDHISIDDAHQLYAYNRCFETDAGVLLYPEIDAPLARCYETLGGPSAGRPDGHIHVRSVDITDLPDNREKLTEELTSLLSDAMPPGVPPMMRHFA